MYTLDANIFVRDLDTREPDHAVCHELIGRLMARAIPIIVPLIVLAEVAGTVSHTRRDPMAGRLASDALRDIPSITFLPLDEALAQESAEIAADHALRGADAIYVAVARRTGSALVSLDREQREAPRLSWPYERRRKHWRRLQRRDGARLRRSAGSTVDMPPKMV